MSTKNTYITCDKYRYSYPENDTIIGPIKEINLGDIEDVPPKKFGTHKKVFAEVTKHFPISIQENHIDKERTHVVNFTKELGKYVFKVVLAGTALKVHVNKDRFCWTAKKDYRPGHDYLVEWSEEGSLVDGEIYE